MKRTASALVLLLLLAHAALAGLAIKGDLKAPQHKLVKLSADGVAEGAALLWAKKDSVVEHPQRRCSQARFSDSEN